MPSPTRVRYVVLVWLCAAAGISYLCRNSLAVVEKEVRDGLSLADITLLGYVLTPRRQMAWVMSAFFLTYALLQVPAAWVVRSLGTRRSLPLFAALWSLAAALSAGAHGWATMMASRLGMGAAQAGIFTATTLTTSRWFPAGGRAFPNGAVASFMSLGAAATTYLTAEWVGALGPSSWRGAFALYAALGVVWAAAFYAWFRETPREHPAVGEAERALIGVGPDDPKGNKEPTPWAAILTSPAMVLICVQQFFRAAGYILFSTWFPSYLRETRGVELKDVGLLASLPFLAVVVGSPIGGALSDVVVRRTGSRRLARQGVALASLLACATLAGLAYPVAGALPAVLLISAGQFFHAVAGPCAYTITIDMGGRHVPTVFSLMNMAGNVGAAVFPVVVAELVERRGWDVVLPLYVGITLAATVAWALINPNGTVTGEAVARTAEKEPS